MMCLTARLETVDMFQKVEYGELNPKQRKIYNFQKITAVPA